MVVHNFGLGDSIDLANLAYSSGDTLSWNSSNNTLTINGATGESIRFGEGHSLSDFTLTAGPLGGTDIVYNDTPNYGGGALWGHVIMNSPGAEVIGGVNNNGVALITGASGAGQDYYDVNGHLVGLSGAPLNNFGGIGESLGSGINDGQEIVLTHEDTAGDLGAETYTGKFDSSTGLDDASGGTSAILTGPSQLDVSGQPSYEGQGLGINNAGVVVGEFQDLSGVAHGHWVIQNGVGDTPYEYGFIYNPSTHAYTGVDAGSSITSELPSGHYISGGLPANEVYDTVLTAINNEGVAVGYYVDSSDAQHAFVLNTNTGVFDVLSGLNASFNFSDSPTSVVATGINDDGVVVGYYAVTPTGAVGINPNGGANQSFVYQYDASTNSGGYLNTEFTVSGSDVSLLGINNNGMVTAEDGGDNLIVASVQPTVTIDAGGTLYVTAPDYNIINFAGGTGELVIDDGGGFHGTIENFTGTGASLSQSDAIDLVGYNYLDHQNWYEHPYSTGILTVVEGLHPTVDLAFQNSATTFAFTSDGNGGTLIFDPPTGRRTARRDRGRQRHGDLRRGHRQAAARRSVRLHRPHRGLHRHRCRTFRCGRSRRRRFQFGEFRRDLSCRDRRAVGDRRHQQRQHHLR